MTTPEFAAIVNTITVDECVPQTDITEILNCHHLQTLFLRFISSIVINMFALRKNAHVIYCKISKCDSVLRLMV